ncbi:hypothetical protein KY327_01110 [Candidatus Woesearchaeota archaeon]|nr:hypothetical protein [Candidatus Woesearchaeota archaeon]
MTRNQTKKKPTSTYIFIVLGVLIAAGLLTLIFTGQRDYEGFAQCLADEGYVMAGTEWCSHCADQKSMFKGAFDDVIRPEGAYKDCDRDKQWCEEQGIEGYPTWVTPDGNKIAGVQKLPTLARISSCDL